MHQPLRRLRTGLAACALVLAAAGTAQAQYAFDDAIMPPRAVAWRLAERGFTEIGRPRFDGRAYVVEAFNPNGARVRLFVDAQDGAILGRQRLDEGPVAIARPAPGYGWTEDDEGPRRPMRQAERLLPPADIPMPESRGMPLRRPPMDVEPTRPDGSMGGQSRSLADPNPQGVNPDRRSRGEQPRKLARVGSPAKAPEGKALDGKALTRTVPEAPRLRPVEAAKPDTNNPDTKPEAPVATADQPKAAPVPGVTPTPAAIQPPADGTEAKSPETKSSASPAAASKAADAKTADVKTPDAKPADQAWKNPQETKRNVRVIGGATLVPGTPDKEAPTP